MGNLKSVWRRYVLNGTPQALNFFALGDAAVRTNPLYGRGCSAGVVHAHLLRDTLDLSDNPRTSALLFDARHAQGAPAVLRLDGAAGPQAIRRAEHERDPDLSSVVGGRG